jgi:hypothetical protein
MALTDGSCMSPADFAAMSGGFGNFGGDGWWIVLLLLFANGGWGGFGGYGNDGVLPYFYNTQTQNDVNRGFDTAALTGQLSGIQTAITDGFANAEVGACNRAMTQMQSNFDNQMALQNCCCENRAGLADLKYTVATEACADRNAVSNALRDVLEANNANTQKILDTMCQDKIDAKNEQILNLQTQLNLANLNASQIQQTATIQAGQVAEVDALYQRLKDCPVGTMPVYGSQPIFTCGQNTSGCGCGM